MENFYQPTINDELEILESITGKTKEFLLTHKEFKIKNERTNKFRELIKRLKNGEPLAYLIGYKYFYSSKFLVNKSVLIPRPESEILVDLALKEIIKRKDNMLNILEVCTGSGCITVSILKELEENKFREKVKITATDISKRALKIALKNSNDLLKNTWIDTQGFNQKENYQFNNLTDSNSHDSLLLRHANVFPETNNERFDLIIGNPPYIETTEVDHLKESVKKYEPRLALDGGKNGMDIYLKIFKRLKNNCKKQTVFILEINHTTSGLLHSITNKYFPEKEAIIQKDLYGKKRYLTIR